MKNAFAASTKDGFVCLKMNERIQDGLNMEFVKYILNKYDCITTKLTRNNPQQNQNVQGCQKHQKMRNNRLGCYRC